MKYLLLTLLLTLGLSASSTHKAKILETLASGGYTYMKVEEGKKSYWIAMTQRNVKIGQSISFTEQALMKKFHSKTLNRTFDTILFASDVISESKNIPDSKANIMHSQYKEKGTISVAELFANPNKYVNKEVTVRGKVGKVSLGIMKKNWVHIGDGSRFENKDDIVFTTSGKVPNTGDIVYAKGKVAKDVDFGYGYFYPVIVQQSSF